MYLRTACFVLLGLASFPIRPAHGQNQETSSTSAVPPSSLPAPSPPEPVPSPSAAPTADYRYPSTPGYASPADATSFQLRDRRYSDAHVDRVLLLPTAETHPQGTLYFSSVEIVLLQAGYAVSDRTQITLTSMPPLPQEKILPVDLTLKSVLVRAPEFRVAVLGSVSGIAGTSLGAVAVGRAGGVVQLCFEKTCRSSISVGSSVALAGPAILAANGAGVVLRVSEHVSALLEVDALLPLGNAVGEYHGMAIAPGIRFSGKHLGLDLALAHSLDVLEGPAIPFLAATYRTGPD